MLNNKEVSYIHRLEAFFKYFSLSSMIKLFEDQDVLIATQKVDVFGGYKQEKGGLTKGST